MNEEQTKATNGHISDQILQRLMDDHAVLLDRLPEQQRCIETQAQRIRALEHTDSTNPQNNPTSGRVSRAGLIKAGAAAVVGLVSADALGSQAAFAEAEPTSIETSRAVQAVGNAVNPTFYNGIGFQTPQDTSASGFTYGGDFWGSVYGIRATSPATTGVFGDSTSGLGVAAHSNGPTALQAVSNSGSSNASVTHSIFISPTPGADTTAVWGENRGANANGSGVLGTHAGGGAGVKGNSNTGFGLQATSGGPIALKSSTTSSADQSTAIYGVLSATSSGNFSAAVWGENQGSNANGYGTFGKHHGGGLGVYGESQSGTGVQGYSFSGYGGTFGTSIFGNAQLMLQPYSGAGHPTGGNHTAGEIYMDSAANLFVCTTSGSPGTWRQIAYSGPTDARIAHFHATRRGDRVTFNWRVADGRGIAGFDLYAASRRLNRHTIRPHRGKGYRVETRWKGNGPFVLHIIMEDGHALTIDAS